MPSKFASGKHSIAQCDRCGWRAKLSELKEIYIKLKKANILVCSTCYEEDHPQWMQGLYPINDPQAVRNPRPDLRTDVANEYQFTGFDQYGVMVFTLEITPDYGSIEVTGLAPTVTVA